MKIFVSSTHEDLKDYHQRVVELIRFLGHTPMSMVIDHSAPQVTTKRIDQLIDESDAFIGIYAFQYGGYPRIKETSRTRGESRKNTTARSLTKSYLELEFERAFKSNKPIYTFFADPEKCDPSLLEFAEQKGSEKAEKLKRLHAFIRQNTTFKVFQTPADLIIKISPVIQQFALNSPSINRDWYIFMQNLPERQKRYAIKGLTQARNEKHKLTEQAYNGAVELISGNFKSLKNHYSKEFKELVISIFEKELDSDFQLDAKFVKDANRLSEAKSSNILLSDSNKVFLLCLSALLLGFLLAITSYAYNWPGARSVYSLFGKSFHKDMATWVFEEHIDRDANYALLSPDSPKYQEYLYALKLVYQYDKEDKSLNTYLNQKLIDIEIKAKNDSIPKLTLENYINKLRLYCKEVEYEKACVLYDELSKFAARKLDSIEVDNYLSQLESDFSNNNGLPNDSLLRKYTYVYDNYQTSLTEQEKVSILGRRQALKAAISAYDSVSTLVTGDTITILGKIDIWRAFYEKWETFRTSPAILNAQRQIGSNEKLRDDGPLILTPDDLIVCKNVDTERKSYSGQTDVFTANVSVWVWAKLKSLRWENVYVKWYSNGKEIRQNGPISVKGTGFRIYYQKGYNQDEKGMAEVRIYRKNNELLIGRRKFRIN